MMNFKDITKGFFGGYAFGFGMVLFYVIAKAFITFHIGLDSISFIWEDYTLARALIVAGILGIGFVWSVEYEGKER